MHNPTFLSLLALFLDTFDTAQALSFEYPRQTALQDDISGLNSGWTPRPTSAPKFAPWLARAEQGPLWVRQDVELRSCGFLSADPDMPLDCNKGEVCAYYDLGEVKNFVCCPRTASGHIEAGYCPYRSMCFQYGAPENEHWGLGTIVNDNGVLSCGADEPYCYAMANSESAGGNTWYFFGCDATPGFYSAAMTPTIKTAVSRPIDESSSRIPSPSPSSEQEESNADQGPPLNSNASQTRVASPPFEDGQPEILQQDKPAIVNLEPGS